MLFRFNTILGPTNNTSVLSDQNNVTRHDINFLYQQYTANIFGEILWELGAKHLASHTLSERFFKVLPQSKILKIKIKCLNKKQKKTKKTR